MEVESSYNPLLYQSGLCESLVSQLSTRGRPLSITGRKPSQVGKVELGVRWGYIMLSWGRIGDAGRKLQQWVITRPSSRCTNHLYHRCHRRFLCRVLSAEGRSVVTIMFCSINHFSTTGRCSGPAHYDVSITSILKIFLTQTFPRCGATCYILPSRAMTQLFIGVNSVYRSVEVYLTFCSYLRVLVRIRNFYNGGRF